jgi:predicted MFS family arabinose efflux permease
MAGVLAALVPLHTWALRGPALVAGPAHEDPQADATLHQALRHRAFWLLTLAFMLYAFGQAAFWAHVMPAFAGKGVAEAEALWVLMAIGPAQVAGRLLYVAVGRGWRLRRLGTVVMTLLPLSLLLFALSSRFGVLLLFALLFGIANGLVTIVRGGLVPLYFGRSHVGRIGGLMSAIGLFARAAAPVLTAWLLLAVPGYREVMGVLAGLGALAVLAFWAAGPPRGGAG